MPERPVCPGDCGIALTFPTTRAEFEVDLADPRKDFAKHLVSAQYEKVAAYLARATEELEGLGSTVKSRARLDNVRDLAASFPVVVIFAHSRFVPFEVDDVVDPGGLLERLRSEGVPSITELRTRLEAAHPGLLDEREAIRVDCDDWRAKLAAALNRAIEPSRAFYETTATDTRRDPGWAAAREPSTVRLTRALVEDLFADQVARAPAVEFADGLHPFSALVDAMGTDFDGVADLSICNSVFLGESIRRRNRSCCAVLVNEFLTPIAFRAALCVFTIRALKGCKMTYTQATLQVRRAIAGAA